MLASVSADRSLRVYANAPASAKSHKKKKKGAAAAGVLDAATCKQLHVLKQYPRVAEDAAAAAAAPDGRQGSALGALLTSLLDEPCAVSATNPKTEGTKIFARYEAYKGATKLREVLALGGTRDDVYQDVTRGAVAVADPEKHAALAAAIAAHKPAPRKSGGAAPLFADETVTSFFRRAAWTPDGALLLAPTGVARGADAGAAAAAAAAAEPKQHPQSPSPPTAPSVAAFGTHVFARSALDKPAAFLPSCGKPPIAVRCCPRLFARKPEPEAGAAAGAAAATTATTWCAAPHRSVFCVLTLDSLLVYDTQHSYPLAVAANMWVFVLRDRAAPQPPYY